ncbi:MAG: hypothetical protein JKX85_01475 [Phycisphaeraceae bacterium]|nr:hypothetical protein [Phycisphaeraceae bacterium]
MIKKMTLTATHWCAAACVLGTMICGITKATEMAPSEPKLGINLAGPEDWGTELPFVDVFKFSRLWITQKPGVPWGKGPKLDLDEHGWVKRLAPGCFAETTMLTGLQGHYPSGRYTILYEGKGRIEIRNGHQVITQSPGRMVVKVNSKDDNIWLRILETDPTNYIRNIHVIMPGFEKTYQENPWHPDFLKRWRGFACLRFMDFMKTNNSQIIRWQDRPKLSDASWAVGRGIPLEMLCDLANRLDANPWLCMPHQADDDYIRQFATMAKQLLKPELKMYVEYSNEVWNGGFQQNHYAAQQGIKLGFAKKKVPWLAAWKFTGHRSKQIFAIWEDVFGGTDQLIRVLASQAVVPYVSKQILLQEDVYQHADALAIGPYMYISHTDQKGADAVAASGVKGVLDELENKGLPKAIDVMRKQKAVADMYGLKLVSYESGQHLVGVGNGANNKALTKVLIAANTHPRMGDLYRKYYAAWSEIGGDMIAAFSSVSKSSKWGSWGLMQFYDEDPVSQPKMKETLKQAKAWKQNVYGLH